MTAKWRVLVDSKPFGFGGRRIYIGRQEFNGAFSVMMPAAFELLAPGTYITDDKAWMSENPHYENDTDGLLQALLEAAWEIGLRPKAFEQPTNELGATRRHLDDMRAIVSTKLEVPLK